MPRSPLARTWSPSPPSEGSRQSNPAHYGTAPRARDSIETSGPEVNAVTQSLSTFQFAPSAVTHDLQTAQGYPPTDPFASTQLRPNPPGTLSWGSCDRMQQPRDNYSSERRSDRSPLWLQGSDLVEGRSQPPHGPSRQSKPPRRPPPALPSFPILRSLEPANYNELGDYRSRGNDSNPPEAQPSLAPLAGQAGQADASINIPPQIRQKQARKWTCEFEDPDRGYCGLVFTRVPRAMRHHEEIHGRQKIACPKCEKPVLGYKDAYNLGTHMYRDHKDLDMEERRRVTDTVQ